MLQTYRVVLTHEAEAMLTALADRRVQQILLDKMRGLSHEPEKQGKPLVGDLSGYRSLRAAGQRYRIIYRIERKRITVVVIAAGLRKEGSRSDIYALAQKLLKLKLIEPT
jgi:mRNA interferase RelE/StbE